MRETKGGCRKLTGKWKYSLKKTSAVPIDCCGIGLQLTVRSADFPCSEWRRLCTCHAFTYLWWNLFCLYSLLYFSLISGSNIVLVLTRSLKAPQKQQTWRSREGTSTQHQRNWEISSETWIPILTTKATSRPSDGMLCSRAKATFLLQGFCCK